MLDVCAGLKTTRRRVMTNIETYVNHKMNTRDDIPVKIFELAKSAPSKRAAQKIIRRFLSRNDLPKGVVNGCAS
jgi:hypothetical protein